jgi:hypothetical protein
MVGAVTVRLQPPRSEGRARPASRRRCRLGRRTLQREWGQGGSRDKRNDRAVREIYRDRRRATLRRLADRVAYRRLPGQTRAPNRPGRNRSGPRGGPQRVCHSSVYTEHLTWRVVCAPPSWTRDDTNVKCLPDGG